MKTILFAAHDPGGANVVLPIIEFYSQLKNYSIILALLGPACERIRIGRPNVCYVDLVGFNVPGFPNEKTTSEEEIIKLFKENKIDLTFTATSFNSSLEKLIIKHSKLQNIPSASIIDSWSNYRSRFLHKGVVYFPNIIFVTDEKMKEGFTKVHSNSKIIISGNPHLQKLSKKFSKKNDRETISSKKKIRFFSDNIRYYFPTRKENELTIVENILKFLSDNNVSLNFLVRPHPLESIEPWHDFFKIMMEKYSLNNISLKLDRNEFEEVLEDEFIAVGMSSMALIETSICGIPTFSYQADISYDDYFHIPFEEYGIKRILSLEDLSRVFFSNIVKAPIKIKLKPSLEIIKSSVDDWLRSSNTN